MKYRIIHRGTKADNFYKIQQKTLWMWDDLMEKYKTLEEAQRKMSDLESYYDRVVS